MIKQPADYIREATTLDDITAIIVDRPINILACTDALIAKLNHIQIDFSPTFVRAIIDAHYRYYSDHSDNLYEILRAYAQKVDRITYTSEDDITDVIILMCIDELYLEKVIVDPQVFEKLYGYIVDQFIPSEYADELVAYGCEVDLYRTCIGTADGKYQNNSIITDPVYLADLKSLIARVKMLRSSATNRIDLLLDMYQYQLKALYVSSGLATMIARYQKYLPDVDCVIASILGSIGDPERSLGAIADDINVIIDNLYKREISPAIIESLFSDVADSFSNLFYDDKKKEYYYKKLTNREHIVFGEIRQEIVKQLKVEDALVDERRNAMHVATEANNTVKVKVPNNKKVSANGTKIKTPKPSKTGDAAANAADAIQRGYEAFKDGANEVDKGLTKLVETGKKMILGDVRTEMIEGKKFTVFGMVKKCLRTAAIFSGGKLAGLFLLLVRYCMRKKTRLSEKRKIAMELETELELLDEKIDDARGDGNRQAKYAMMRTRSELKKALDRIKYGLEADVKSTETAKAVLSGKKQV